MAIREMSLEELLSKRQFVNPLDMSEYEAEFGRQELADLIASRQEIVGTGVVPMGATGLVGSALEQVGALEGRRAAAAAEMASRARSARNKEFAQAAFKRQVEEAEAKRATRAAQRELEGKALELFGNVAGQGIQAVESIVPQVRKDVAHREAVAAEDAMHLRKARENQAARVALQAEMSTDAMARQRERLLGEGFRMDPPRAAGPLGAGLLLPATEDVTDEEGNVIKGSPARRVLTRGPSVAEGLRTSFWNPMTKNYESLLGAFPQYELVNPPPQTEPAPAASSPYQLQPQTIPAMEKTPVFPGLSRDLPSSPPPYERPFQLSSAFPDYYQSMFESANFPSLEY